MIEKVNFQKINILSGDVINKHYESFEKTLQWHQLVFHGFGIVQGYLQNCDLSIFKDKFPYELEIKPGAVIDKKGRLFVIDKPISIKIFTLPGEKNSCIYIYLFLKEYEINDNDSHIIKLVPECKLSYHPLHEEHFIEIARIKLPPDGERISLPKDPKNPQSGEIDRRYVPLAFGNHIPIQTRYKHMFLEGISKRKQLINALYLSHPNLEHIPAFIDFRTALLIVQLNISSGLISFSLLPDIIKELIVLELEMLDVLRNGYDQEVQFKQVISNIMDSITEIKNKCEESFEENKKWLELIEDFTTKINELYEKIIKKSEKDIAYFAQSCNKFENVIIIENEKFQLIDIIHFSNLEELKKSGKLLYSGTDAPWESSHEIIYPDDSRLNAVVCSFKSEFIELKLTGFRRGKDTLFFLAQRPEMLQQELAALVNNNEKFDWGTHTHLKKSDYGYNKFIKVPGSSISEDRLSFKIFSKNKSEIQLIALWIYQKL